MHDPDSLAGVADQVIVMFGGKIVEISSTRPYAPSALHPYARQLTRCEPAVDVPSDRRPSAGCAFQHRCTRVQDRCRLEEPELVRATEGTMVRCFFWK
jgi:oligopeptide/dipeptide ABC transporter ATP-binding protein